jgi:predicted dehydrogenase
MTDDKLNNEKPDNTDKTAENKTSIFSRRDILKGFATIPVLGALSYAFYKKRKFDISRETNILKDISLDEKIDWFDSRPIEGETIRIGLIGFGIRGPQLAEGLGFMHPERLESLRAASLENKNDTRYQEFLEQEYLNIKITAVCDVFTVYARRAQEAGANIKRLGYEGKYEEKPLIYNRWEDLVHSPEVDAVVIATPDHWHAPMSIEAAKAGKHVYCEKPMSWTVPETYELRKIIKETGVVFQLGHQHRQTESHFRAREVIQKGLLGKVSLVEITTNRNSPNGGWVYPIHPEANEKTIDWKQFLGQAPYHEFSLERFFRWRCWWDYSTGLSGDLLTHEFDAMNQIFQYGIPDTAVSSGGIYYFHDGRTVPDVLHTVFEYTQKELTIMYSATLANSHERGKLIMGHDATMELGKNMNIYADYFSTLFKDRIENGDIETAYPILSFTPGKDKVDAVTSATEKYFASRGLLYTYVKGKRVNTVHLHLREWLSCIKNGGTPSCNIDQGFEEAITAHMGTIAYKEGRKVSWDRVNEEII